MDGKDMRTAVIGIGGAGCNVISDVHIDHSMDVIAITSDEKRYEALDIKQRIFIPKALSTTRNNVANDIKKVLSGYDVAYIVAGVGGETGTDFAPIVASIAKDLGITVHSILISPFEFESMRVAIAKDGIATMRMLCSSTVVIENERSLEKYGDLTLNEIFSRINQTIVSYINKQQDVNMRTFHDRLIDNEKTSIRTTMVQRSLASY